MVESEARHEIHNKSSHCVVLIARSGVVFASTAVCVRVLCSFFPSFSQDSYCYKYLLLSSDISVNAERRRNQKEEKKRRSAIFIIKIKFCRRAKRKKKKIVQIEGKRKPFGFLFTFFFLDSNCVLFELFGRLIIYAICERILNSSISLYIFHFFLFICFRCALPIVLARSSCECLFLCAVPCIWQLAFYIYFLCSKSETK